MFDPMDLIDDKSTLFRIVDLHKAGDNPLPEKTINQITGVLIGQQASIVLHTFSSARLLAIWFAIPWT